jgi:hypothetical protein
MNIFTKLTLILALTTSLFGQQPSKSTADQPAATKASTESRDPAPTLNFFKLAFVMYELEDGKRTNQRDYMMIGKTNNQAASSVRIETRVPIYTEEGKKMTYVDAGLTLRCNLMEQADHKLQANCDIEISGFINRSSPEQLANNGAPVLRTTRVSSWALLTLGKSTVIATVDDINSTKRMQVELTATKVD